MSREHMFPNPKISILKICSLESERESKRENNNILSDMKNITRSYEANKLFSFYLKKKYNKLGANNKINDIKDIKKDKFYLSNYLTISNNFLKERNKIKFENINCTEKEYFLNYKNKLKNKLISLNNINTFLNEKNIEKEDFNIIVKDLQIKKNLFSYEDNNINKKQIEEDKEDFLFLISHNRDKKENFQKLKKKFNKILDNECIKKHQELKIGNFDNRDECKRNITFTSIKNIKRNFEIKNKKFFLTQRNDKLDIEKFSNINLINKTIEKKNIRNYKFSFQTKLNKDVHINLKKSKQERINKIDAKKEQDNLEKQNKLYLKMLCNLEKRILKSCYSNIKEIKIFNKLNTLSY